MKCACWAVWILLAPSLSTVRAQSPDSAIPQPGDGPQPRAASPFAGNARVAPKPVKAAVLTPLSPRERVQQLLDRFTFGPTPGQVDRVLAQGEEPWLTQQMQPGTVPDGALTQRLKEYPTVAMTPAQAIAIFPDRPQINAVADNREEPPNDPLLHAVFDVQYAKLMQERDRKKADGTTAPAPEPTDAEKAAQHKLDQASASRIFGELFALPKDQRMKFILASSVHDRILLTTNGNLTPDQRNHLFAEFTPREREAFVAMSGQVSSSGNLINELAQARVLRDILSERQLEAVMTAFWFNHFNVYAPKDSDQWYTASYERDVIRAHALGSFRDLLLATAQSPAMMVYLDNWLSIGPDSLANGVNPQNPRSKKGSKGLNENYGREVMELHTVGVNGGYTQADVIAAAKVLTGWTVDHPQFGGGFLFTPNRHEPGSKKVMGQKIKQSGEREGEALLHMLATRPATAQMLSRELAVRFVSDNPPQSLVDRMAKTYLSTNGDISAVMETLFHSPEFWANSNDGVKVKTPLEYIVSAVRASNADVTNYAPLVNQVRVMGMPLFGCVQPNGYAWTSGAWVNTGDLIDRMNFALMLASNQFPGINVDWSNPTTTNPGAFAQAVPTPAQEEARLEWLLLPQGASATTRAAVLQRFQAFQRQTTPDAAQVRPVAEAESLQWVSPQIVRAREDALLAGLLMGSPDFQRR